MFEAVPQELKEQAEKALRKASRDVFEVLELAEELVGQVSETLEEWADELSAQSGGTQDKPLTSQEKYQYLLDAGTENEKQLYSQEHIKSYLLNTPDVLDSLYESKVTEATGPFESQWDSFSTDWLNKDWFKRN